MSRFVFAFLWTLVAVLAGCATAPPLPEEIAKLKGGTTTVVAYGFCVPMDHLIKTTLTRHTMTFVVDGKDVGTMQTCSYKTFSVPSGYWEAEFINRGGLNLPRLLSPPSMKFRPGATQYLYIAPAGNGTYSYNWVDKANGTYSYNWVDKATADKGIAEIKKISQVF
jgi:hypothetical protein